MGMGLHVLNVRLCKQEYTRDKLGSELLGRTLHRYPTRSPVVIFQELCESRGGRPELSVLTSLLVSVDVKLY